MYKKNLDVIVTLTFCFPAVFTAGRCPCPLAIIAGQAGGVDEGIVFEALVSSDCWVFEATARNVV